MRPITPLQHPPQATVRVPGSKSHTNRALLIAALAQGETTLINPLFSDDSRYFARALQTLGFDLTLDEAACRMIIHGQGGHIPSARAELFIGNAGTAARFLTAFLTLGRGEYILDGDSRMRERPIGDLLRALRQLGANIAPLNLSAPFPSPPVRILASGLPGGQASVAGDISSQFLSALLMVAPYAQVPVEITLTTELNSQPYVEMTLSVMRDFGVEIQRTGLESFTITSSRYTPIPSYAIEADASAASYYFAIPAICGGELRVANTSRQSRQGDVGFLDVLLQMGCTVTEESSAIVVTCAAPPRGVDVDMRHIPDTAQTLAAIAPFAQTPTRIRGIASARLKETDRVAATCAELARLGVRVEEHPDGMTIHPAPNLQQAKPHPVVIRTYNDHRMAMAFSLIGLRVPGVVIENPACVSKTFPNFFDVLETLR